MGLLERLHNGGSVLIAEGYMWELERRGYVKLGSFTPEVVLQRPEMVKMLHEEFAHAGSDVCEAYTYHAIRYKLRDLGTEDEFEKLNRKSLQMARQVADSTGSLMAGNICQTWQYNPEDEQAIMDIRSMYKEQIEWAAEEGADYIIGETFKYLGEAMLALETIKAYGKGLPAVITLTAHISDITVEGIPIPEACRQLEEAGAAVVGLNCTRGPKTMLPLVKEIRKVCKGPIAAIPVPYRTNDKEPTFQTLTHPDTEVSMWDTFEVKIEVERMGEVSIENSADNKIEVNLGTSTAVKEARAKGGLLDRLKNGGNILIAEGFLWEFERRGYVKFGEFTPETILKHPEMIQMMHQDFARAGSDVCEAYTYNGNRYKLKRLGIEEDLENLNRKALKVARQVADETGSLMAGDLSHTWLYKPGGENKEVSEMFKEQVEWAVDEGADYIIGETFENFGEAMLALQTIKEYGNGIPAVITLTAYIPDETMDGIPVPEACKRLEDAGAAVVGLNCGRGPKTMLPLIKEIRKVCKGPIAAIPVPFRCDDTYKTFQSLCHPETGANLYPADLCCMMCSRTELRQYAEEFKASGVQYFGVCCGNSPAYMREVAEVFGRKPEASDYSPDMSRSLYMSSNPDQGNIRKFMFGEKK